MFESLEATLVRNSAAFSAAQISAFPSKAGAVSQNSSRLARSCASLSGTSLFHRIRSCFSGLFLVVGKREESERAEGEALPRRPPEGLPTQPPIYPDGRQGAAICNIVSIRICSAGS